MRATIDLSSPDFGLTQQEIVVGCLVALHTRLREAEGDHPQRAEAFDKSAWTKALAQELVNFHQALLDLEDGDLSSIQFRGVPRWMVEQGEDNELLLRVVAAFESAISAHPIHELRPAHLDGLRDAFLELTEQLSKSRPCPAFSQGALDPRALAARGQDGASFAETVGDAETEPDAHAALEARAWRLDIPMADKGGGYFLMGADLEERNKPDVRVTHERGLDPPGGWEPADKTFKKGIAAGARAAMSLLRTKHAEPSREVEGAVVTLRGMLPPYKATGDSVGLPVALEILRRHLGLPPLECVASGAIGQTKDGFFVKPLCPDIARAKLRAVQDDGFRRKLFAVTEEPLSCDGLITLSGRRVTLDAVARKLWPHDYSNKLERAAGLKLRDLGVFQGWKDEPLPDPDGDNIFVRTKQADDLFQRFLRATNPTGWIVSGPTRTGKTWLVWDVMRRLADTNEWDFGALHVADNSPRNHAELLTNLEKIVEAVRGVLNPFLRRVVVLDGIEYGEELEELDAAIQDLAERASIHIVAVRQSDIHSDWRAPRCKDVPSIHGTAAINDFVTALVDQHRSLLVRAGVTEAELRDACDLDCKRLHSASEEDPSAEPRPAGRDIWWITEQARGTASLSALREKLVDGIAPPHLHILTKIAYASLYGFGVATDQSSALSSETLRRFVIHRDHRTGELRMVQPLIAYATINKGAERRPRWLDQKIGAKEIAPIVRHYIQEGDFERVTEIFDTLARGWIPTLRALIRGLWVAGKRIDALIDRDLLTKLTDASFCYTPADAARLAIVTSDHIAPHQTAELLKNLLGALIHRLTPPGAAIRCHELRICLNAIEVHLGLFWERERYEGSGDEDEELTARIPALIDRWGQIEHLLSMGGALGQILEEEKHPGERLRLAEALFRLDNKELRNEVRGLYDQFFDGVDDLQDRKYEHAIRVLHLIERIELIDVASEAGRSDDQSDEPSHWLVEDRAHEVVSSATVESEFSGLREFCGWARLALKLGMFESRIANEDPCAELYEPFAHLMATASLREITQALNAFYDEKSAILNRLLDRSRDVVSSDLLTPKRGSLGDVQAFLFAAQRWHRDLSLSMIWLDPDAARPNKRLAESLAQWAREELDARNAGLIIKATARLDDMVTESPSSGFAYHFVDCLGLDFILGRIRSEPRTAIIFHLIEGLASIEHSFLQQVINEVVDQIADAINQRTMSPWPARLAVMLCEAPRTGEVFKEAITAPGRVNREAILEVMCNAQNLETLDAFHRLAALLDDLPERYVKKRVSPAESGQALISRMRVDGRADLMLLAARSIGETYRRAGQLDAAVLPRDLHYARIHNALRAMPAESVNVVLDQLHMLSPRLARDYVSLDRACQLMGDKFSRLVRNPEGAAELLLSLERIVPGSGLDLLKLRPNRLRALEHQIQFLQNPRSFARAINLLNRVGYRTDDRLMKLYTRIVEPKMGMLRSPALLVELLLMLRRFDADWGSDWFQKAVKKINETGLKKRLACRLDADLVFFAALITLIAEGGPRDLAEDLANALARIDELPRRLPSECWFGMLRAVCAVTPDAAEHLIPKFDEVVVERSSRPVQLDDVMLWQAVGAYALFRRDKIGSCWDGFATCPSNLLVPKDPATRLFATAWLDPNGWVREFQDRAVQQISQNPGSVPTDMRQLVTLITLSPNRPEAMIALSWPTPLTEAPVSFGPFRDTDAEAIRALLQT